MKQNKIKTYVLGVTGGIGTGKSTVSKILNKFGLSIIDADMVARDVVKEGKQAYFDIVKEFGEEILLKNGKINRKLLGDIVFNDESMLDKLNSITHKYITKEIKKLINESKTNVVIESAIPFKDIFEEICNQVWCIESSVENRIQRIISRSKYSQDKAIEIIRIQDSKYNYKKESYIKIANDTNINILYKKVEEELNKI